MTDRELLDLAAKAAGIKTSLHKETDSLWIDGPRVWNPLNDDGDALRLAVKLKFYIQTFMASGFTGAGGFVNMQTELPSSSQDRYAATRRAIVRAAAEIGKGMK